MYRSGLCTKKYRPWGLFFLFFPCIPPLLPLPLAPPPPTPAPCGLAIMPCVNKIRLYWSVGSNPGDCEDSSVFYVEFPSVCLVMIKLSVEGNNTPLDSGRTQKKKFFPAIAFGSRNKVSELINFLLQQTHYLLNGTSLMWLNETCICRMLFINADEDRLFIYLLRFQTNFNLNHFYPILWQNNIWPENF